MCTLLDVLRGEKGTAEKTAELLRNIRFETIQTMGKFFDMAAHQSIGTIVMVQIAWWGWHGARWLLLARNGQAPCHKNEPSKKTRYRDNFTS